MPNSKYLASIATLSQTLKNKIQISVGGQVASNQVRDEFKLPVST